MTLHRQTLRSVFILLAGGFLILNALAKTSTTTPDRAITGPAKVKDAKKLFKQHCVKCHGANGVAETALGQIVGATDLTDPEWQERVDDQRLVNSITHGRSQMPAFGKKLTKEQITSLLAYVRAFKR